MKKPLLSILLAMSVLFLFCGGVRAEGPARIRLETIKKEVLPAGKGVKSVIMNSDCSSVYSINLEDMSVFEFERESRKIKRKLVFIPHKGRGFDYSSKSWINSYQEKPVEAHLTHNDRFLWISLHNAGGVVVWDLQGGDTYVPGRPYKEAWLHELPPEEDTENLDTNFIKRKVRLLLLETGTTPKVITTSPDGEYLFVANWHSNSVSIIKINSPEPKDWIKSMDLKTLVVPRGLAVSPDSRRLYIAQMGGDVVSILDLESMKKVRDIKVGVNPRHILTDGSFLYASLNKVSKLVKVDLETGEIVKGVNTCALPRTIALSRDGKILFAACYRGNAIQAFSADDLSLLGSWESRVHPVAVDIYQQDETIEAWVGNYTSGELNIFTLKGDAPGLMQMANPTP